MRSIVSYLKISFLFPITLVFAGIILIGLCFVGLSRKYSLIWKSFVVSIWAKVCLFGFRVRYQVDGVAPKAPFILVSNHVSYLDILLLCAQTNCVFIAKKEVANWPIVGFLAKLVETIFIDREKRKDVTRVNAAIQENLSENKGIVIFPEGKTTDGKNVDPFKGALLDLPAKIQMPVNYCSITYQTPPGEEPACNVIGWAGKDSLSSNIMKILRTKKIYAKISFGQETVEQENRKALANTLHELVLQKFIPLGNKNLRLADANSAF